MPHPLDRAIWNALNTAHAGLAEGDGAARRYPVSIIPFAAMRDDDPESGSALAGLAKPGEALFLVEREDSPVPPGFRLAMRADILQMEAVGPTAPPEDARIVPLGAKDAAEMLVLAQLTKPGPFTLRAQDLGQFWGIRVGGRLAAMAGQRMRLPGYAELSGLCTHPDFRGRGFGSLLFRHVTGSIAARGEIAFLHTFADNAPAISLYRALGFRDRAPFRLCVLERC